MNWFQTQRGLSLIGFMFVLLIILFFAFIGIKLVPIYMNHLSLMSEVRAVASEPGAANQTPNALRRELQRRIEISYIKHVEPQHFRVERGANAQLVVMYDVQQHLIGNIDAVIRFNSAEPLRN